MIQVNLCALRAIFHTRRGHGYELKHYPLVARIA
jgi:hypothetical protein